MDNVIILKRALLLANILVGYEINRVHIMAEQIHDSTLWMNTSFSFPILIHSLCIEAGVRISLYIDPYVKTMDPSLIKADKNLVAL